MPLLLSGLPAHVTFALEVLFWLLLVFQIQFQDGRILSFCLLMTCFGPSLGPKVLLTKLYKSQPGLSVTLPRLLVSKTFMTVQGSASPFPDPLREIRTHLWVYLGLKFRSLTNLSFKCTYFSFLFPSHPCSFYSPVLETTCSPRQCIWPDELLSEVDSKLQCGLSWDHDMPELKVNIESADLKELEF